MSDEHDIDWEAIAADSGPAGVARLRRILRTYRGALDSQSAAKASGQTWNGLLLGERLGRGSFGSVYAAQEPDLQREVAVKLFDPSSLSSRRWLEEARLLAGVRHPHVVAVYGADVRDGQAGIWMERVPGRALAAVLEDGARLPSEAVLDLARQLASALQAIHARGLVHGDLKAANVMLEPGGRAVLLDFGAAWRSSEATLQTVASPLTSAPEVLDGREAGTASDLYSLGVLLYRCLAGEYPFAADSLDALRAAQRRPAKLAGLPKDWRRLLGALLDPDASRRPAIGAATQALLRIEQGPARQRVARLQAGVAAALLLALVVAVGGLMAQREAREQAEAAAAEANRQAERSKASLAVLQEQIGAAVRGRKGRETTVVDMLESVAAKLEEGTPADPFVRATLKYQLGASFEELGDPERGVSFLRASLAELDRLRPREAQAEALVRFNLGDTLCQSQPEEALAQAESLAELSLPLAQLNAAKLRACAAQTQGDNAAAEAHLRKALSLAPPVAERTLYDWGLWQHLGELLRERGALDEALEVTVAAEHGLTERYGANHPSTLGATRYVAFVLLERGEHEEALDRLERVLADSERRLGRQSSDWVANADMLATTLMRLGRIDEALDLQEEVVVAGDSALPTRNLGRIQLRHNLVARRYEAGRVDAAMALSDALLTQVAAELEPRHPLAVIVGLRRIELDLDLARGADAQHRIQQMADPILSLDRDHQFVRYFRLFSAELASQTGQIGEAGDILAELSAVETKDVDFRAQLAFFHALHQWRVHGGSPAPHLQAALETSRSELGPDHPLTRRIERRLAAADTP